jgi:hypothetical protein
MENVLSVDVSKYTVELKNNSTLDSVPLTNDNRKITDMLYGLTSEQSDIDITFSLEKGHMVSCGLYPLRGEILTNKQYNNQLAAVKGFLERYQTYTKIDSNKLITMLNNVDPTKDTTIITESTKLTIANVYIWEKYQTAFTWTTTINGADYPMLVLVFDTEGNFIWVSESRELYTIGDTSVNISLRQAVDIAIENLQFYSYEMSDGEVVKDFRVSDAVMVELVVGPANYVDYELRPYYDVSLYLDKVYPGNVFGIKVFIWANSGEIISYSNMATGGINYGDGTTTINSATASEPKSNTILIGTAIITIVAIVAAGMLIFRKKHK